MSTASPSSFFPPNSSLFRNISYCTKDKIKAPRLGSVAEFHRVVEGQIPNDLKPALEADFTESEIFEIAHRCNVYSAPENNEKPAALWIFGPPACGKTSITSEKAAEFFGHDKNAVTIDGDIFRTVHKGFQMVTLHGSRNALVHKDAWDTLKKSGHMDKIKEVILDHAVEHDQHLKIPEAASNKKRINAMLNTLESAGYEMHAICLWAPKSVTEARGRPRSIKEGKAFNTDVYAGSTRNTYSFGRHWEDQITKGNVHYKSVAYYDNTVFPPCIVNAAEFEQLTNMTDDESSQHARTCAEHEKQVCAMSSKAASEARAKGVAPRRILCAQTTALREFNDAKAIKLGDMSRFNRDVSTCSPVGRSVELALVPGLFWAKLQHCRFEGIMASVVLTCLVVFVLYNFSWSGLGLKHEL